MTLPMARMLTAETLLEGRALSSFGACAWRPGLSLSDEGQPGRREAGDPGRPVVRW